MTSEEAIKILNPDADNVWRAYDGKDLERCNEACRVACVALAKQIPKKPIKYDKYYYKCPVCDIDIGVSEEDLTIYEETPPHHCKDCGQALDWGD